MGKWSKEEVEEYKIDVKMFKELNVLSGEKVDRNNDTKVITNTIYENSMYTGCWYSKLQSRAILFQKAMNLEQLKTILEIYYIHV